VAFAGAAHSHPIADAANLSARGATVTGVWEADDAGRRRDFATRFGATEHDTLEQLLADRPDLVVATPRTPRAPEVLAACSAAGIPVFFNKTVAVSVGALTTFDAAAASGARVASSSVLRFAPAVVAFAAGLAGSRVRAVEVIAQHDIAGFLVPERSWQDDPAGGGGTLLSIGVHAVDLVDAVLPGGDAALAEATLVDAHATAGDLATRSEAVAVVRAETAGGIPVTATVSGVPGPDRYAMRVVADDGLHELALGEGDDLGYAGLADALLAFATGGPSPVPWHRTSTGYRLLLAAAVRTRGMEDVA
jgi:predicted dehydrogenase